MVVAHLKYAQCILISNRVLLQNIYFLTFLYFLGVSIYAYYLRTLLLSLVLGYYDVKNTNTVIILLLSNV